jgi:hypothetical protein
VVAEDKMISRGLIEGGRHTGSHFLSGIGRKQRFSRMAADELCILLFILQEKLHVRGRLTGWRPLMSQE